MKGIVLAGGTGSRLRPMTAIVNKHLLCVYDKPMIYYPLSVLMLAGIREVLIICNENDIELFKALLGDGSQIGMSIDYSVQHNPSGIAEAFIIGENFIGTDSVCLILGDNLFIGEGFPNSLRECCKLVDGGIIYGYKVADPRAFGVVEFNQDGLVQSIEEKPSIPKSNYAVTGLYFYDNNAPYYAKTLKKSLRGELEITALNQIYLENKQLRAEILGRTFIWKDMGTITDLSSAASVVEDLQRYQGYMVACIEEIAFNNNWIDGEALMQRASHYKNTFYGEYLRNMNQL